MKNYVKAILVSVLTLTVGIGSVNAYTGSSKIDTSVCDTVYTNYYFFVDANTPSFFNKSELSKIQHDTVARYSNNSYQINNFNKNNVGYGSVTVNRNSTTSNDGITSMSISDFYKIVQKAEKTSGGAYSEGTKNYIVSHDWYSINSNGTANKENGYVNLGNSSINSLINATLDAKVSFDRETAINPAQQNPFVIDIFRDYYGYLTGTPVTIGNHDWYLHPALYYVQYCGTKQAEPVKKTYTVTYYPNGSNVTNMPNNQQEYENVCLNISTKIPVRPGYKFLGWGTTTNKVDSRFAPGSQYCGEYGNINLYAIWEKEAEPEPVVDYYNVWYKPNTTDLVTGMPQDNTGIKNDRDVYISSNIPIRSGYTFLGWNTDANATEPNYTGGYLYQDRKDLTLYAIWKKNPDPVIPDKPDPVIPDNPQTGIEDTLIPFGGVALVAGIGLQVLKKKGLKF